MMRASERAELSNWLSQRNVQHGTASQMKVNNPFHHIIKRFAPNFPASSISVFVFETKNARECLCFRRAESYERQSREHRPSKFLFRCLNIDAISIETRRGWLLNALRGASEGNSDRRTAASGADFNERVPEASRDVTSVRGLRS